jgi:hypothetical protein
MKKTMRAYLTLKRAAATSKLRRVLPIFAE